MLGNCLQRMRRRTRRLARASESEDSRSVFGADPVGYVERELGVGTLWSKQKEIARLLLVPPYRVLVKAGHATGKTMLAGALVNWWHDTYKPGVVLTTAPTFRQVVDLLWKEVRVQRSRAGKIGGFAGDKAPRLETAPDHYAHGFTTNDSDRFQGHHSPHTLIIFDEAVGVGPEFWEVAPSMVKGRGHAWLCIFNPTDTSSQAYLEEQRGGWHVVTMSALEHPNIAAELAGLPPPIPSAVRLEWLAERIREWCMPLEAGQEPSPAIDIEFPPGSGKWWRPGPVAEARLLGRWPSQATNTVWSDALWAATLRVLPGPGAKALLVIGCDVARYGDDFTAIHVRHGNVSLHHESVNGWSTTQTAGRLKQLARQYAGVASMPAEDVPILVDDDGVGGGVIDQRGDFNFIGMSASAAARDSDSYPNRRSELWFALAKRAEMGCASFARLSHDVQMRLKQQFMAPKWKLDAAGRRVVEKKEDTKETLRGRSPDDADATNLAYFEVPEFNVPDIEQPERGGLVRPRASGRRFLGAR